MHQPLVAADGLTGDEMYNWHCYLLVVKASWHRSWHELGWCVIVWQVCPDAVGKEIYSLLTDDVIMLNPTVYWEQLDLRPVCGGSVQRCWIETC
jgi:hypothetical protein